jgi:NAD(P)-dependent dehydrogenase (short-subunit alcohol dehydrogenase family)
MNLHLQEKLALITGSSAGIGYAIAEGLAREGASVILNGRAAPRLEQAVDAIRKKYPESKVEGFVGDLSTLEACNSLTAKYPVVDILVNNLGIFNPQPFEEISDDEWRKFFEVNVLSGVRLSRAYLPQMRQNN